MMLSVQLFHALARDVGIYLRRGKVAVTQQHLHDAQVGAVVQQVRGKRVTQVCGERAFATPAFCA
jgi:hypothetical protein